MAEIYKDEIKNGIRTISFVPYAIDLNTKDRGIVNFNVKFVAVNDSISTKFTFCICYNTKNSQLNISGDKRLLFYDRNKNVCVIKSGNCPGLFSSVQPGFNIAISHSYEIEDSQIENLKLLGWSFLRVETNTSFFETTNNSSLAAHLYECIQISKQALKNTSEYFFNI